MRKARGSETPYTQREGMNVRKDIEGGVELLMLDRLFRETEGWIRGSHLASMKRGATFDNTSRGRGQGRWADLRGEGSRDGLSTRSPK